MRTIELYQSGARACARGQGIDVCEWPERSPEWEAWTAGWWDESYREEKR